MSHGRCQSERSRTAEHRRGHSDLEKQSKQNYVHRKSSTCSGATSEHCSRRSEKTVHYQSHSPSAGTLDPSRTLREPAQINRLNPPRNDFETEDPSFMEVTSCSTDRNHQHLGRANDNDCSRKRKRLPSPLEPRQRSRVGSSTTSEDHSRRIDRAVRTQSPSKHAVIVDPIKDCRHRLTGRHISSST